MLLFVSLPPVPVHQKYENTHVPTLWSYTIFLCLSFDHENSAQIQDGICYQSMDCRPQEVCMTPGLSVIHIGIEEEEEVGC